MKRNDDNLFSTSVCIEHLIWMHKQGQTRLHKFCQMSLTGHPYIIPISPKLWPMTFEWLPLLFTILLPLPIITICLITNYTFLEYNIFFIYTRPHPINATNKYRCWIKLGPLFFEDTCTLVINSIMFQYIKIKILILIAFY